MAYGKDIFRTKYREANEGLKIVQNNYLELDHEYQMLAKRVEKAREFIIDKCIMSDVWKEQKFNKFIPIGHIKYKSLSSKNTEKLYSILGGDDNENKND